MQEIIIRKRANGRTREEIAAKNSKTMRKLEKTALQAVHGALKGLKNRKKLQDDIRSGEKEVTIITTDDNLLVKDDYCTYVCSGKRKTYRRGTQEQVILEHLIREKANSYGGKLSIERLVGILENNCLLSRDKGAISRTVTAARDRINRFFGFSLIKTDNKGSYWIGTIIKK